jgi:conjugative relaxase-like TrwC/TraI family protein
MIRITQQDSAGAAKKYYSVADYYSEGQEIVGLWGGKGASRLGLEGTVDKVSFERLCENLDPKTGKQLTARTRNGRTVGYDFTFSVPKSVSLLYGLSEDKQILGAFRSAVDETMREIEMEMKTRVRKGGKDEDRLTGNMVWAEFIHTTSRPVDGHPDPQLHAHVFAFNTTWDEKEAYWKAGKFRELKRDAPYFQAAFRVRLANRLQDLGFGVARKRDDFEIGGIPKDVLKRFSRRTAVIEKVAEEKGITNPDRKAELGAETRERKEKTLTWKELRQVWRKSLSNAEWELLMTVFRRERAQARPERGEDKAVDHALQHSFVREAVVPERMLVTEALKRGLGAVTVEGVKREVEKRPLIRSDIDGRKMATTQEMLALESRMIEFARKGRGRCRPLGDPNRPIDRDPFNEGQKAAVRHVLGSRDRVMVIRGAAGTGKTSLEDELRIALEEKGVPVAAMAQSTGAVDELRDKSGFAHAATIARFLKDTKMQESVRQGVMLIDEASLVGTRDMMRLIDVAESAGARVVLVGDRRQHRSVAAGEPLKLLEERAGLPVAEVTEIVRQVEGDYRKATQALSDGKVEEGFAELDKKGWIVEIPHAGRYWALAQGYLSSILERKKNGEHKTALCVSPTHAEGDRITHFIRGALKADGKLGEERTFSTWMPAQLTEAEKSDVTNYDPGDMLQFHQNAKGHKKGSRMVVAEGAKLPVQHADRFEVYRPSTLSLAVNDRIRVTLNGKTRDGKHKLKNGDLFTVQGFTRQGDLIVDKGWVISRKFGHIAYGYAVTSHAAQGKTVDKVFIGLSSDSLPAINQRSFYVPVTRGKAQAVIFTDSKDELLRAVQRPDEAMSATELSETMPKPTTRNPLMRSLAFVRGAGVLGLRQPIIPPPVAKNQEIERGLDHDR